MKIENVYRPELALHRPWKLYRATTWRSEFRYCTDPSSQVGIPYRVFEMAYLEFQMTSSWVFLTPEMLYLKTAAPQAGAKDDAAIVNLKAF